MWAAAPGAVNLQVGLRLATWRFPLAAPTMEPMRAAIAVLAVLGYGALAAALGVSVATGDGSEAGWILVGPLPFCVIGAIGFLRRPENRVVWWLVGVGAAFGAQTALGDVFLPMAERHWGTGASVTALVALLCQWAGTANEVAAIGMIGLFPSGRPQRGYERVVIWTSVVVAVLLPLLDAVSAANIALTGVPGQGVPIVHSGVSLAALAPLRGTFVAAFNSYPFWTIAGVALLALRYWQGKAAERRQIRWLLIGVTGSFSLWVPLFLLWWEAAPASAATNVVATVLSALAIATALVAMLTALFYTGVFGIDEPGRRALVHRVLRVSIATAVAIAAVTAGLLTSLAAPAAVAVVVGVTAAAGGQAIRGRLEHAADRWVLGSRLAGYANLNRFGRSLIQAPGSDGLLSDLAGEVRRGLDLTWAQVSLGRCGRSRTARRPVSRPRPCPSNIAAPSWDASSAARVPTARCWPRTAGCWHISPPRPRWACTTSTLPRNSPGASRRSGTRRPNWRRPAIALWRAKTPSAGGFSGSCTTGSSRRSWRCRPGPGWCASNCGTAGLAYLLKDRIGEVGRLLEALREVSAGGSLIDPQVVEALVRGRARVRASALRDLTPRELDVLREMAAGRGNAGIAAHLHLSESSVEKHVNAIFTKLSLTTEDLSHRRVTAVLTFLRDAGLRG
jgi:DNA-binding CsgD family transcriptional regulator